MVRPGWTHEVRTRGAECFDASKAHSPLGGVQNNTRWTHWALPEGPPPPGGWPVIVTFEVMGFFPVEGDNSTCGDGWHAHYGPPLPPPSPFCSSLLADAERACAAAKRTGNHTVCQQCIYGWSRLHNTTMCRSRPGQPTAFNQQLYSYCPRPQGKGGHGHHSSIHPFAKPDDVLAPEFASNGTWLGPSMGGGDGGFDEHAGLLWLQRVRQYTLANGIAWVILNPYMGKPPRYRRRLGAIASF